MYFYGLRYMYFLALDIIYKYICIYLYIEYSVFIINLSFHLKTCYLFDIFHIYPTIYKVDNIFQLIAFHIAFMTSMNLICYHFIKSSSLNLLYIICHMDIMYRSQFIYNGKLVIVPYIIYI